MDHLVPSPRAADDLEALGSRVGELEAALRDRLAAIERAETDIAAFTVSYRSQVGLLHEELDDLECAIADAERQLRATHAADREPLAEPSPRPSKAEPLPRFTSDGVRKLFRDVAKAIHPDRAADDAARQRRHRLMIEANRAYALGDAERLRTILRSWEMSPEAVHGSDDEAVRARLIRRMAEIEEELAVCARALTELQALPMWKLKTMVDEAAGRGRDLVREMVRRLERDVLVARNRLDAIRSAP